MLSLKFVFDNNYLCEVRMKGGWGVLEIVYA